MEQISCPNCGVDDARPWGSENGFTAVRCTPCGLVYVNPRPSEDTITEANKAGVHQGEDALNVKGHRSPGKVTYYSGILRGMFAAEKPKRWLDVGAGYGEVVEAVNGLFPGVEAIGLEPMQPKVKAAQALGLNVSDMTLDEAGSGFDVISLINVYSHIPDFDSFAAILVEKLKPGGVLFVETGNVAELRSRREFPDILYLPDHLVFSGEPQMRQTFTRLGLALEQVQRRRLSSAFFAKMFVKRLLRKEFAPVLPGSSGLRMMYYKARKPL